MDAEKLKQIGKFSEYIMKAIVIADKLKETKVNGVE